ncbi:MAG TPA: branched-chain amino acid ABC transporter substrate-binding protein [Sedimenticola thiotaurini]|uniref:Branched-chain amino acid ABC transporter substrate-binding protein n=1 Tax=Sedimenticola thiotaurini TaxID=1543721 RepID=A0A831W926_9GAMM|nr:branched-chain amino acid ABC transporter substrate-binding protein [Sedimenticola thiotaurini]
MKSKLGRTVLIAAISAVLAAPVMAAETIKLGVAGAHSGDLASYGLPSVNAAKLVVQDINARGGIDGKKVELLVEDDVCKPEVATNTATKLVSEGVDVVLGHICSGATKAALPIYKNAGVVVMSPSATNPALTQSGDYPNFFRTIASDDAQARTEVDFAINRLGVKKIAVIHDKGDYGKGLAEFAKKFIDQSGGKAEVVLFEGITPGAVDYSAIVQKIKRSGADAVIFGGYHPEASKIVTQMRKKRMKTYFISDDGVKDDTFIKVAGKYAEGVYATGPKDTSQNPLSKAAVAQHKKVYGTDPGAFYENAYAAALALLNAIDKANSTDMAAVKKALQTNDVDTPVGKIHFDDKGDAVGVGFAMYQVKDGKYVEVK